MGRRVNLVVIVGLAVALLVTLLVWRAGHNGHVPPDSFLSSPVEPTRVAVSPLRPPTRTPFPVTGPLPPTGTPPVTQATLEALRAWRPTATPPPAAHSPWPYISPDWWRRWALHILALAGLLGYIGWRLRPRQ